MNFDLFYYYYKVRYYWDDNTEHVSEGVTFGESWVEAMKNLVNYYGDNEMVEILNFAILGDGGECLEKEFIENCFKEKEG